MDKLHWTLLRFSVIILGTPLIHFVQYIIYKQIATKCNYTESQEISLIHSNKINLF